MRIRDHVLLSAAMLTLCSSISARELNAITEGFNPGDGKTLAIAVEPGKSVDTGFMWRGFQGNLFGMNMLNDQSYGIGVCLDFSGVGRGYDGVTVHGV